MKRGPWDLPAYRIRTAFHSLVYKGLKKVSGDNDKKRCQRGQQKRARKQSLMGAYIMSDFFS